MIDEPAMVGDDAPGAGSEIAGYRIQSVLGEGGMGAVYLAVRPQGGQCALKLLSRRAGLDLSTATRFRREAKYAAALNHPNIPELYDVGETADGTPFLAMEYIPGADLRVLLARDGVLDLAQALLILGQVGDALDRAHANGLVHRDVKPANIIVRHDADGAPHAYLSDFGLSKNADQDSIALTKQGQLIGTMPYTAPEEILAQPRDHRVDIYSLGCVLYESLVGVPPFVRERELDVLYAHIGDPRPHATASRSDLPAGIDAVIAKAMAIAPAERYSSCAELIAAARAVIDAQAPVMSEADFDQGSHSSGAPAGGASEPEPAESRPPSRDDPTAERSHEPGSDRPRALRLVVGAGFGVGRELPVEDEVALGRLTTLDGALADDRDISRRHALVRRAQDGRFLVEDQGSANGTFVNGTRIAGPHPLQVGDELQIGATVFAVSAPAGSDAGARQPAAQPFASPPPAAPVQSDAGRVPADEASAPHAGAPTGDPGPAARPTDATGTADAPHTPPRLALRLEVDLESGEVVIAFEGGGGARVVRDGDGWSVEAL